LQPRKIVLSWSSGKDSAWALHILRTGEEFEVVGLLTTINSANGRVSMHGSAGEIVTAQADSAKLPLYKIPIPWPCTNDQYEAAMTGALSEISDRWDVDHVAFGDLFLEDIRAYRQDRCAKAGWTPIFPVWGIPTDRLALQMIDSGLTARIACVDTRRLPESFAGREFDKSLLADLPSGIDPCAENGEFHTLVTSGPMFSVPIEVSYHGVVRYESFVYADLRLGE
jgi:uncharacterized protein (TIGR00290 family)